jgi:hypothetical protein
MHDLTDAKRGRFLQTAGIGGVSLRRPCGLTYTANGASVATTFRSFPARLPPKRQRRSSRALSSRSIPAHHTVSRRPTGSPAPPPPATP